MEIQADTVLSTEHDNARPAVEIVVPVFNEERDLAASIRRLQAFVSSSFPFSARVTIADNGSTDGTWAIATALAGWLPGVRALRIPEAGRGRALQTVWSASDAEVVAYMDVDLSTDLSALLPLVAPLLSGQSDLAIGTRLWAPLGSSAGSSGSSSPGATTPSSTPSSRRASPTPSAVSRQSVRTGRAPCCRTSGTGPGSSTPSCSCSRNGWA